MADQKISALTEVTAPASTDVVPIVNSATTKKVQLVNLVKLGNVALTARAYHNTTQSIADSTFVAISLNSERWDTDTIHDTVTNNSRLTCKTAGLYVIHAHLGYASHATGRRYLIIRLNGTTEICRESQTAVNGSATTLTVATEYQLAVNDYVEMVAWQNSGGALNTEQVANYSPELAMTRLGA